MLVACLKFVLMTSNAKNQNLLCSCFLILHRTCFFPFDLLGNSGRARGHLQRTALLPEFSTCIDAHELPSVHLTSIAGRPFVSYMVAC